MDRFVSLKSASFFLFCCIATSIALTQEASQQKTDQSATEYFDKTIAPLLANRCLSCHNSTETEGELDLSQLKSVLKGGENGPALNQKSPKESLLWQRIAEDEMPPEKPLTAEEKKIIGKWIQAGAKWGSEKIDPFRYTTASNAGYDWWSFQSVTRPKLPTVKSKSWPSNGIDAFVLSRLEQAGLTPSKKADRRTLVCRLSFDLTGLPPEPDVVQAFVEDDSPKAYENLVNRLLDSPHYGEHWARHWLDIVRFGESQGFERDRIRENSWRYRDWVVTALNQDMPYDKFVRQQIAGDVIDPKNPQSVIATGFLVAAPYDEVGQSQQSATMRAVVRQDELEDLISAIGQTFLGLTVNCARCHDHKFDPVTQVEYYRLAASLAGVRHGERPLPAFSEEQSLQKQIAGYENSLAELQRQLHAIEAPAREKILASRKKLNSIQPKPPVPLARWDFDENLKDSLGKLHGTAHGNARIKNGQLILDGSSHVATTELSKDIKQKTLEAWVRLDNLDQRGGGVITLQTLNGGSFDSIVFGERDAGQWMAGSNGFVRTKSFLGPKEKMAVKERVHVAIVYSKDGKIQGYRNGQPYGNPYQSSGPLVFQEGKSQIIFGLRHFPPGGNRFLTATIDRAQLYDRALNSAEVAASAGVKSAFISEKELLARLSKKQIDQRNQLTTEIDQQQRLVNRVKADKVYAVVPRKPEETFLLVRGNSAQKSTLLTPGAVHAVKQLDADFKLKHPDNDGDRRRALADWITNKRNPLFARAIVNRLWHYHFGIGLVDTPSDLGFNGGKPTHPELIDWLAAELIENDWSLKHLHRQILLSATYRQSSEFRNNASIKDANNRLLWRKSPMRLEAESIRDSILTVSGVLNRQLGGPGYWDFTTFTRNTQFYTMTDPVGESFNRRSLYRTWVRSGRNLFLDVFDCPDPSTKAPKRAVTTTPLQALSLMNNSFVLRMSDQFAARIEKASGPEVDHQIQTAYKLAYSRQPDTAELKLCRDFLKTNSLSALCRVIFNSSEFLYVD